MVSRRWVLFKRSRKSSRWNLFNENYWTGGFTPSNKPQSSSKVADAEYFESARDAYDVAAKHKQLNWWQVGEREVELLH